MEKNFDEAAAIRLGKNKNTSADVLSTLIGHSDKVDRLVAKHPHADASVLGKLSGSLDIKTFEYLLLNPHAPFETVLAIASTLIAGKGGGRSIHEIYVELGRLLVGEASSIRYGRNRITVEKPDILPPGVQRTYRIPDSGRIARKLLQDYLKNPDREQLAIQMAKNKKTSADVLAALFGCSVSIDRFIAKHPNTDGLILEELVESKDKTIRRNVFLNPNSGEFAIARLAPEFPDKFIRLPAKVLNELIAEHSACIIGIGQAPLFQILSHPKCPPSLLDWACKRGGLNEQLAVWKNPSAPAELLREMMVAGYPQEANVLLALPEKILELLNGLGFAGSPPKSYEELHEYHGWLDNMSDKTTELWAKLVPEEGEAETVQGEMVRARGRIQGDYYRNGFGNWHQCYELSRFLADHLADENTFNPFTASVIRADIRALDSIGQWCMYSENLEQTFLGSVHDTGKIFQRLGAAIVVWCERHPEPIPYNRKK